MLRAPVRLSASTFEVLWQWMRLGDLPAPLFVPAVGATVEERQAVERAARDELIRLKLVDGDELADDLTLALQLLARPTSEFYGWLVRPDNSVVSALVATHADKAVLAILKGDRVRLSGVPATDPAQRLVDLVPWVPPVRPARSITVPADRFYFGARGDEVDLRVLEDNTRSSGDAEVVKLRALVAEPSTGRGQLFTATRDHLGRRHKSTEPIYYLDTGQGRWLLHTTARRGGAPWLTAAPGSPDALVRALYDSNRQLTA
ncbi:MAG TPA: ESX secretion-associated protein EspG [Pseudonocardiaceae bacterium]|jgi:hypothetical protein|nr:ESX secretion-associated protein EspG [Pseudonocardiaceae bacterium]